MRRANSGTKTKIHAGQNNRPIKHEGVEAITRANINEGIQTGLFNGATVALVTPQGREIVCGGRNGPNGQPMHDKMVYDIASLTKAVLSALFHSMAGKDASSLTSNAYVRDHLPQLGGEYSDLLQAKHLLQFTARFLHSEPVSKMVELGIDPIEHILAGGLSMKPGSKFMYCNHSSIVLGHMLEACSGISLDALMQTHLFNPLRMTETTFRPLEIPNALLTRFVPTEAGDIGVVHDEGANAMMLKRNKAIGSAGLFSTPADMLSFLAMLLDDGLSPSQGTIIPKDVVKKLGINYLPRNAERKFGNGFGLWSYFCQGYEDVAVLSNGGIFKTAFTGCFLVCLPGDDIGFFIGTDFLTLGDRDKQFLYRWVVKTISDIVRLRRHQHAVASSKK